jgi:hypothetical protein
MALARGDRVPFWFVRKASRLFALAYSVAAGVIAFVNPMGDLPFVPWSAVCLSAVALGCVAAAYRPLTLLCAAHAGLTATWAGTLAPELTRRHHVTIEGLAGPPVFSLLALCVGMTVMIAFGLKSARLAQAKANPPR